jgi:hypothetical protein
MRRNLGSFRTDVSSAQSSNLGETAGIRPPEVVLVRRDEPLVPESNMRTWVNNGFERNSRKVEGLHGLKDLAEAHSFPWPQSCKKSDDQQAGRLSLGHP